MKKLTAERCKRQIEEWQRMMSVSDVAVMVELNLQAYLIALPVLEGRIKSSLLPIEVFDRLYDQYLMGVICGKDNKNAAKGFLEACFVAIHESLPVLEQQEKGNEGRVDNAVLNDE